MKLLEGLQRRAMRWIVRQAFGRDPKELAAVLHGLNEAVYRQANQVAELERVARDILTEVVPHQIAQVAELQRWRREADRTVRQHNVFFFVLAREVGSPRVTKAFGVNVFRVRCEACGADALTPCRTDRPAPLGHAYVCEKRHEAAINDAIRLAEAFK